MDELFQLKKKQKKDGPVLLFLVLLSFADCRFRNKAAMEYLGSLKYLRSPRVYLISCEIDRGEGHLQFSWDCPYPEDCGVFPG